MGSVVTFHGRSVLAGTATGFAIAADTPLSFWGGYDPDTGEIIDQRHPLAGEYGPDRVLVIPSGRGSCSGSGVILEAIRNGKAPAAIITSSIDPIIALGAVLGDELYGSHPVIVVVDDRLRRHINSGDEVSIDRNGHVTVTSNVAPRGPHRT